MPAPKPKRKRLEWNEDGEEALLELWPERAEELSLHWKNGRIYAKMAEDINNKLGYNYTGRHIQVKLQNLTQRYRKEKEWMRISGGSPSTWFYYERVHKIIGGFHANLCTEFVIESRHALRSLGGTNEKCLIDPSIKYELSSPPSTSLSAPPSPCTIGPQSPVPITATSALDPVNKEMESNFKYSLSLSPSTPLSAPASPLNLVPQSPAPSTVASALEPVNKELSSHFHDPGIKSSLSSPSTPMSAPASPLTLVPQTPVPSTAASTLDPVKDIRNNFQDPYIKSSLSLSSSTPLSVPPSPLTPVPQSPISSTAASALEPEKSNFQATVLQKFENLSTDIAEYIKKSEKNSKELIEIQKKKADSLEEIAKHCQELKNAFISFLNKN